MRNHIRIFRPLFTITTLLIFASMPLSAAGPLANCQDGVPYRWASGGVNIPFNPDQGDLGPLDHAAAVAAVAAAFDVWAAVPTSTVSYQQGAELPVDVNITNFAIYENAPAPDGLSAIVFDDTGEIFDLLYGPGSGVLGFAGPEWGNVPTCTITEGLAFLNGPAFDDLVAALDVMVHEFGHYNNLAHTVVNGQIYLGSVGGDDTGPTPLNPYAPPHPLLNDVVETMYPFYYGPGIGTASLERDDIASVSALYPHASFATTTAPISGTIFAPNGMTRVSGVNVIARNEADPFNDAVSAISGDYTDSNSQTSPVVGTYTLFGLTPGANYRVYVDELLAGGFSTPPASLPGPEEYHSGASESNNITSPDQVADFVFVQPGTSGVNVIFNQPAPGEPLSTGDDGSVEIALPFPVEICGQTFNSVSINGNGNITFGASSSDFTESIPEFLAGPPRIAGLWDDLSPNAGGTVTYNQSSNTFSVHYTNVPEFPANGSNTFSIHLKRSAGHIDIVYGQMTAIDGLAGVSCGGAVTSGFETASDLSTLSGRINLHNQPAVFELFNSANPNDLSAHILPFTGTTNYNDNWAEKNDTLNKARRISIPFDSIGVNRFTEIDPTGNDVDFFRITAPAGTSLLAEIIGGQLDTILVVADLAGNVLGFDDDSGPGLLSRAIVPIPATGDYYVGISTFPDGSFTGAGDSGGRYVLRLSTIEGTVLGLGDDNSIEVPLGFSFPYQGSSYSSVFVNANGNLTFGTGNGDFSESAAELRSGPPRIAPLWDDLSPNNGGLVIVEGDATSWSVNFQGVPEFSATGSNTFTLTLHSSGQVTIDYGNVTALDGLVGVSPGGGAPVVVESNLSSAIAWPVAGTTFELFTGAADPFDLDLIGLQFNP